MLNAILKNRKLSELKKPTLKRVLTILIILALAGGAGYFGYKYNQARDDIQRLANPQEAAKEQSAQLVEKVAKLVKLPSEETPTIVTVSDISKLKKQPFFAQAENGDKVLIFTQARRAILYRPSTDKIIELAPINIGENNNQQVQPGQPVKKQ